jgi:hypothetical protein
MAQITTLYVTALPGPYHTWSAKTPAILTYSPGPEIRAAREGLSIRAAESFELEIRATEVGALIIRGGEEL